MSQKPYYTATDYNLIKTTIGLAALLTLSIVVGAVYQTALLIAHIQWFTIFSVVLPTTALVLAVVTVSVKHPVHSLLALITVFFITVILYLAARAEFLALIFLIVYVGAIAILFLFVIMLLNVKELTSAPRQNFVFTQLVAIHLVVPLSTLLLCRLSTAIELFIQRSDVLSFTTEPTSAAALVNFVNYQFIDIQMFSTLLYTQQSSLFMLAALLLLTAMLGAIVLASGATDSSVDAVSSVSEKSGAPL